MMVQRLSVHFGGNKLSSPQGGSRRHSFRPDLHAFKVAPYSFLSARALISKISRWRKRSNSTPKSRARSRSKTRTNMASKLLKFVYRKRCLDRLRFENICRLNRRPYLLLLDFDVCKSFNKWSWFVRLPRSSSGAKQDGILPHIIAVLGVVCGVDTKAKI